MRCPGCGDEVGESEARCECGRSLLRVARKQSRVCIHCKMDVAEDATICGHCGQGISTAHHVLSVVQVLLFAAAIYYMWPYLKLMLPK